MNTLISNARTKLALAAIAAVMLTVGIGGNAWAQTNPAPQALPYSQDFSGLLHTSTTYPAGWQGWTISTTPGAAFNTAGPTADRALVASRDASVTNGDVDNYNGKIGFLNNGSLDLSLALAINTSGKSSIAVGYDIMTIRNPQDGSNTRQNEVTLQYRVGTTGAWTSLTGISYTNLTGAANNQTGAVTTPQNLQTKSITLPAACENQPILQLRWASRQVSGAGSRPSFAVDNVSITGTTITYTLTYTAGANGSIVGTSPQTVPSGGSGTLVTATPDPGYHFVAWSDGYPTAARTDVNVMADVNATATFAINTYTLTYTAGANGSIVGTSPQTVPYGGNGTLVTATPDPGYHFVAWSDGYPTAARTDMNVTADVNATASFAINTYTLTYLAGANGSISGTTPQTVNHGASGSAVTAVADPGYHFTSWSDGGLTASRTDTNVMADLTVTASFAVNTVAGNTVDAGPASGAITLANPTATVPVRITRTSGSPAIMAFSVTFTVNQPQIVLPAGRNSITLPAGGGYLNAAADRTVTLQTVDLGGGMYQADGTTLGLPCGSSALTGTLFNIEVSSAALAGVGTVTINSVTLRDCGNIDVASAIGTVGMVLVDRTAPAIAVTAPNGGEIWHVGSSQNITWTGGDAEGVASYDLAYSTDGGATYPNAITTLPGTASSYAWTIPPAPGTTVRVRVTGQDVNGNAGADASDANFTIAYYTLTYLAGPNGTISGTTPQSVGHGASGSAVTAVPNAGYHFTSWSDGVLTATRTDTNVMADLTVTASFAINTYTLTYTAGPNGSIVGTSPQTVPSGGNGTLVTATPDPGYHFVAWSDGYPTAARTDMNVTADVNATASFAINTYTLTYLAGPNGTISGTTPQTVNHGASGTPVTAVPDPGYVFTSWSDGVLTATRTDTDVMADLTVTASFATAPAGNNALAFDGISQHVTFGAAPELGATHFTLELWFKKTGAGVTTNSGSGGVVAVPLIAKGLHEVDGDTRDANYFMGIDAAGHLVADYEEGTGQLSPGQNHPVIGSAVIANGVWYHGAAVFDGSSLRLYLNGVADGATTGLAGRNPQSASIQHASLATAINSTGTPEGFFAGVIDEPRVWGVAHTQCEVIASMNLEVPSGTGLLGRWGLNEGLGSTAGNSVGGSPNGTLVNGPPWVPGAPFDLPAPVVPTPNAPTALDASAPDAYQVQLTWTDNATSESGFEIERSTSGNGGPFTLLATVGPDVTSHVDAVLDPSTEYCYRVRATGCAGASDYAAVDCATTTAALCKALAFSPSGAGTNAYVRVDNTAALQLAQFTLELWLRRDAAGISTPTASGGIPDAIPLITKGRSQDDTPTNNVNYFFGIRQSDGVLAADFEEGPAGPNPGISHPVVGATPLSMGVWQHLAATYDGTTWKLYLNGNLDGLLAVNRPVADVSTVAVALAGALNGLSVPSGYLEGAMDEVRIWNYARTQGDIQSTMMQEITAPTAGLVARWGLDEGAGTVVFGTAGTGIQGSIIGSAVTDWNRVQCIFELVSVNGVDPVVELELNPVAPNPVRGPASFQFAIPQTTHVRLEILDVTGRRVTTLEDGVRGPGRYEVPWNGRSERGAVANGVYFLHFSGMGREVTRRFVMLTR